MLSCSLIILAGFFWSATVNPDHTQKGKVTQTELYFGMSKMHGGEVTEEQWDSFADSVISKVFANGMTIHGVLGQWQDPRTGQRISENTRLVVGVNEMTKELSARIDTVRAKYCRYHDQASVLRIDQRVKMNY